MFLQKVTKEQGEALAEQYGIKFFETSAKQNINVDEAFFSISQDIVSRLKVNPEHYGSDSSTKVKTGSKNFSDESKSSCC